LTAKPTITPSRLDLQTVLVALLRAYQAATPHPYKIQGQVGRGSEQPDLVEDVPAHCRGVGLDDL